MIDIHDSMGSGKMRSFRVLGAALLDLPRPRLSDLAAASEGPSEGGADSPSEGGSVVTTQDVVSGVAG